MDGTIMPYQMFRISPRICRLSKPAQEQLQQAYAKGESIRSIAQRYNLPEESIRSVIPKGERRRSRTK
jgi:Mor family transcriptional regulator